MSETKSPNDERDLITRRGFVTHAAAAGGAGVLTHMVGGRSDQIFCLLRGPNPAGRTALRIAGPLAKP